MSDSENQPETLGELLRLISRKIVDELHVCMPAQVISYNSSSMTCSIQPISHKRIGTKEIKLPIIEDVPVCFPRAGTSIIELPIAIGDTVTAMIPDRSIENWRDGSNQQPSDPRSHNITDAFVIPMGVWPSTSSPPVTKIKIATNGDITLETNSSVYLGGELAADAVALSSKVAIELNTLKSALTLLQSDMASIATVTGFGTLTSLFLTAMLPNWPNSVAAIKTKAQ